MPESTTLISHFYVEFADRDTAEQFMAALLEIQVETSLHMPDVATFTLLDPRLEWIDSDKIAPGKSIKVLTRSSTRNSEAQTVFDGEIVEIEPGFDHTSHKLVIRAYDRLHRLGRGKQVRSFQNVTDSDVVKRIAQEVGLRVDVGNTRRVYPYLFQNNQSNLEFLRQRALDLGYLLYAFGETLCFKPLAHDTTQIELRWGDGLTEFYPRLTTIGQNVSVTVRGWDPSSRREIVSQVSRGEGMREIGIHTTGGNLAKEAFHIEAKDQISNIPINTQVAADHIAQAVADRQAERFIEAEGACGGNPAVVAGATVKIEAVGSKFSGSYFVTAATHTYNTRQGYSTRFSISGQTPATLLRLLRNENEAQPFLPGLVIGIVTDNKDPNGWGRVKVKYPWLSGEHASDWARIVSVGGGKERGIEFLPEVNDEVLVGFEMGDIHFPFVLGGLWNGQDAPPQKNEQVVSGGHVTKRVIKSRSGHTIVLDDSDGSPGITITDKSGNKIALDSQANKLVIDVKGDISLKANGQVEIKGATISLN